MQYFGFDRPSFQSDYFGFDLSGFDPDADILAAFSGGKQGVFYKILPIHLWQNAARTIPVTQDSDPVGCVDDLSGNGNHATQTVSAARPIYQVGDSRGLVNQLLWSEDFSNTGWGVVRATLIANAAASPFGGMTADKLVESTDATTDHRISNTSISLKVGGSYTYSIYLKSAGRTQVMFYEDTGSSGVRRALFDLGTGSATEFAGTGLNPKMVDVGGGWYRCSITTVGVTKNTGVFVYMALAINSQVSYTGNGTSGLYMWGAQVEESSTATAYQRNNNHLGGVGTGKATDLHWLQFDGVDDHINISNRVLTQPFSIATGYRATLTNGTQVLLGCSAASSEQDVWLGIRSTNTYTQQFGSIRSGDAHANDTTLVRLDVGNGSASSVTVNNSTKLISGNSGTKSDMRIVGAFYFSGILSNFNGKLYGLVAISSLLTNKEKEAVTDYMASKSGVTL